MRSLAQMSPHWKWKFPFLLHGKEASPRRGLRERPPTYPCCACWFLPRWPPRRRPSVWPRRRRPSARRARPRCPWPVAPAPAPWGAPPSSRRSATSSVSVLPRARACALCCRGGWSAARCGVARQRSYAWHRAPACVRAARTLRSAKVSSSACAGGGGGGGGASGGTVVTKCFFDITIGGKPVGELAHLSCSEHAWRARAQRCWRV